jgi:hypothetical protein
MKIPEYNLASALPLFLPLLIGLDTNINAVLIGNADLSIEGSVKYSG